ncbi:multiple sugar transport system ATP-binding protein [Kaistia soli DSM 19436]|uniref:Multiple sugar transport system ATP-binding protein n=1 Tax=Kaistia soli DSM 19436 TaxID=1122133 RepID=A0A1M5DZL3_9HYPH|nr:ABC transporter ATP-binding protein [Kaistia soli]SHF72252.1 multiple sugar transport system ATP-binding protein [Kaistia soli DSM 19436]
MNAIEIRGVVKAYPKFTLGPIDLTIGQGEFFGIFGPPSAGKTSVLKLILGLLNHDKGSVSLGGADASGMEVADRNIAMVFQNLALFPHMSGRENITFPLTERGASQAEIAARLKAVSEVLHVDHILRKNPAQMSGGERQRVALGRALAADSRAILLDEPIAALDTRLREEMRIELKRLQRSNNQTFVYVSHDEEEVMAISDRVAVMIGGRIVQVGVPDDVYNRPNCMAVAQLIGSPPMNLFSGRFSDDGWHFECDAFAAPFPLPERTRPGEVGTLGIRPEDIHQTEDRGALSHEIGISSIEPLGGYTIVNAMLGGQLTKIRAAGQIVRADDHAKRVTFDTRRLHLFDAEANRI